MDTVLEKMGKLNLVTLHRLTSYIHRFMRAPSPRLTSTSNRDRGPGEKEAGALCKRAANARAPRACDEIVCAA